MQAIQLHATPGYDFRLPENLSVTLAATPVKNEPELDDALATVLQAVRQSPNPNAMDALGTLLAYMESLEKTHAAPTNQHYQIALDSPITLSL